MSDTAATSTETAKTILRWGGIPLSYARRTKGPKTPGWQKTPRCEEHEVPRRFDGQNVGALLGRLRGGLVDVDLDSAEAIALAPYFLPKTNAIFGRASKRRSHWLYIVPDCGPYQDVVVGDASVRRTLLELRTTDSDRGFQTMMPGSEHPSGEIVTWDTFGDPRRLPWAELFEAFVDLAIATIFLSEYPQPTTRHDSWKARAGVLCRAAWSLERAQTVVEAVATEAKDAEIGDRLGVVSDTFRRAGDGSEFRGWPSLEREMSKGHVRALRSLLPGSESTGGITADQSPELAWTPFPLNALPEPLRSFAKEAAETVPTDPVYVAFALLVCAASAIGSTGEAVIQRGWKARAILWAAIVAASGEGKTPAFKKVLAFVFERQAQLRAEYERQMEKHKQELASWKTAGGKGVKPSPPVRLQVILSDATSEATAKILEENPRGVVLDAGEMTGFLSSFAQYKSKGADADRSFWINCYDASAIVKDRRTDREHIFIPAPHVSILGGIQLDRVDRIFGNDESDTGLTQRFLLAAPPRVRARLTGRGIGDVAYNDMKLVLERLYQRRSKHTYTLAPDARRCLGDWIAETEEKRWESEAILGSVCAKLRETAARIALVCHCVQEATTEVTSDIVSAETMERAIEIARWSLREFERVHWKQSARRVDRDERKMVRELAEYVQKHAPLSADQLRRRLSRRFPKSSDAGAALDLLVAHGCGEWRFAGTTPKGGSPSRQFHLAADWRQRLSATAATQDRDPAMAGSGDRQRPTPDPDSGESGQEGGNEQNVMMTTATTPLRPNNGRIGGPMAPRLPEGFTLPPAVVEQLRRKQTERAG